MNAPRWWHRIRAWLGGYFWLPCPMCGCMFGGHEEFGVPYDGKATCSRHAGRVESGGP